MQNSNTPSNGDSQLSSRSNSPAGGESTKSKKSYDKEAIGVKKKETVIENNFTTDFDTVRWNRRMKQTKEFKTMNNSQGKL